MKIVKKIKEKKGEGLVYTVIFILIFIMIFCLISEFIRLFIISQGVRDAIQNAVITTINDNYDDVYHSAREGYTGGYMPSGEEFAESIDFSNVGGYIDELLGTVEESIENIYEIIKQNSSLKTEEIFLSVYNKCNPAKDVGNSKERIKLIENQIVEIGKGFKEQQVDIKILEEKQIELIKNLIQFLGFFIDEFELSFKNKEKENEQTKLSIKM
ncbi:hypothetical protein [uncultured Tyzzerella sp.]|uniref:hypothetical protein n=1 Tax=uncultured Tyzzerella sp. TaxID=2321398 RepID=UPI002942489A|nr:hypothetical protein [uncultured Tyzzerella sp.]